MRNYFLKKLMFLIAISTLYYSCNSDDTTINNPIDEKLSIISNNAKKGKYSKELFDMGVSGIKIINENENSLIFTFLTEKNTIFQLHSYDLSEYNFSINDENLSLNEYSIKKVNNSLVIYKSGIELVLKDDNKNINDFDLVILVRVYEDLSSQKSLYSFNEYLNSNIAGRSCPWWNTKTITGIGWTKGGALADLTYATTQSANIGELSGCLSLGSVEYNSNLGGLYWTASQSFCCQ